MDGGSCDGGGSHGGDCDVSHSADGGSAFVDTAVYYTDGGPVTVTLGKKVKAKEEFAWPEFALGLFLGVGFVIFMIWASQHQ